MLSFYAADFGESRDFLFGTERLVYFSLCLCVFVFDDEELRFCFMLFLDAFLVLPGGRDIMRARTFKISGGDTHEGFSLSRAARGLPARFRKRRHAGDSGVIMLATTILLFVLLSAQAAATQQTVPDPSGVIGAMRR